MQQGGSELRSPESEHNSGEDVLSEDEARKRREQLNRRPSYRMILKDLETADKTLKKEPEDDHSPPSSGGDGASSSGAGSLSMPPPTAGGGPLHVQIPGVRGVSVSQPSLTRMDGSPYASPLGGNIMLSQAGAALNQLPLNGGDLTLAGLDAYGAHQSVAAAAALVAASRSQLTPTSSSSAAALASSAGGPPSASSDMHGLKGLNELGTPGGFSNDWSSLMSAGYSSSPSPTLGGNQSMGGCEDESTRKRQVRLLKNREAAKECRRKKKEYVKCLENRVAVLENQNKALIEELKTLKELYCRKEKNDM